MPLAPNALIIVYTVNNHYTSNVFVGKDFILELLNTVIENRNSNEIAAIELEIDK